MSVKNLISICKKLLPNTNSKSADIILVELASKMMEHRLTVQRTKGYLGWQEDSCTISALKERLVIAVDENRMVDALNLAAMIQVKREVLNQE